MQAVLLVISRDSDINEILPTDPALRAKVIFVQAAEVTPAWIRECAEIMGREAASYLAPLAKRHGNDER